jgi:hypothetical protein
MIAGEFILADACCRQYNTSKATSQGLTHFSKLDTWRYNPLLSEVLQNTTNTIFSNVSTNNNNKNKSPYIWTI